MKKQKWTPKKCYGCLLLINAQTGIPTTDYENESTTCRYGFDTRPDYHTDKPCPDKEI